LTWLSSPLPFCFYLTRLSEIIAPTLYCSVTFDEGYKTYYYLTDDDSIEVGDLVMVPAGKDNHLAMVEVVNIEYFHEENAPLTISKTKKIVRKCTDEDFK
jgi:hypothetical protein